MVFTHLGTQDKDAFFSLLDEYFASRPEIFDSSKANAGSATGTNPFRKEGAAAAAAMSRASDAASRFVSAGLKQAGSGSGSGKSTPAPVNATATSGHQADSGTADVYSSGTLADRIAALQGSKSHGGGEDKPGSGSTSNLAGIKKFGDVDTSSAKNFFGSLRNTSSNPPKSSSSFQATHSSPMDNPPSAFSAKNSASKLAPPPTRTAAPAPPPPPQPKPQEEEEEEQGEWAEALYDYESSEPGDLKIKEKQRVFVVERTSDDWWTGEVDGMQGLFPASYVKLL